MFWDAIKKNDLTLVQRIIETENIDKKIKDQYGNSPIHRAISMNYLDLAKLLIENNFDCNLKDEKGQTPLHYCAFYGYVDIAELLLNKNARLDIADIYGNEPLWTAVFNDKGFGKRVDLIKFFLKYGANKNHKNNVDKSPLDFATIANYKEVLEVLNEYK